MRIAEVLMCTLLLVGCTSSFTALRGGQDPAINDLRMEIADLKHALHGTEVEIKLLEERVESAEGTHTTTSLHETSDLKRKISALEKNIDKLAADIRSLTHFSTQTSSTLSVYRDQICTIDNKLDEIAKLRSTLSQLSKPSSYQVKAGDSLEKIARKYQVSVEQLKQENHLSSDRIVIGQELAIPSK
jgi:LysM repeat protein